ncbi:MAG TPA: hypothetical protein VFN10_23415 [Thermoanaerobaculia bacterium]|nr:hypothetical protein [Thermoanaerobaculia bacterium]
MPAVILALLAALAIDPQVASRCEESTMVSRARALASEGRYADAETVLTRCADAHDTLEMRFLFERGNVLMQRSRAEATAAPIEAAVQSYSQALVLARRARDAELLRAVANNLATALLESARPREAADLLLEVGEPAESSSAARYFFNLGVAQARLGDEIHAELSLLRTLELTPTFAPAIEESIHLADLRSDGAAFAAKVASQLVRGGALLSAADVLRFAIGRRWESDRGSIELAAAFTQYLTASNVTAAEFYSAWRSKLGWLERDLLARQRVAALERVYRGAVHANEAANREPFSAWRNRDEDRQTFAEFVTMVGRHMEENHDYADAVTRYLLAATVNASEATALARAAAVVASDDAFPGAHELLAVVTNRYVVERKRFEHSPQKDAEISALIGFAFGRYDSEDDRLKSANFLARAARIYGPARIPDLHAKLAEIYQILGQQDGAMEEYKLAYAQYDDDTKRKELTARILNFGEETTVTAPWPIIMVSEKLLPEVELERIATHDTDVVPPQFLAEEELIGAADAPRRETAEAWLAPTAVDLLRPAKDAFGNFEYYTVSPAAAARQAASLDEVRHFAVVATAPFLANDLSTTFRYRRTDANYDVPSVGSDDRDATGYSLSVNALAGNRAVIIAEVRHDDDLRHGYGVAPARPEDASWKRRDTYNVADVRLARLDGQLQAHGAAFVREVDLQPLVSATQVSLDESGRWRAGETSRVRTTGGSLDVWGALLNPLRRFALKPRDETEQAESGSIGGRWTITTGLSLRGASVSEHRAFGSDDVVVFPASEIGAPTAVARVFRGDRGDYNLADVLGWVAPGYSGDWWSASAGARLRLQSGRGRGEKDDQTVTWRNLLPFARIEIAHNGNDASNPRSLFIAEFNRYASTFPVSVVRWASSRSADYIDYAFADVDSDGMLDPAERDAAVPLRSFGETRVGEAATRSIGSRSAETTDEVTIGFRREILPKKILSDVRIWATFQRITNVLEFRPFVENGEGERPARRGDYVFDRNVIEGVPLYTLTNGLRFSGGGAIVNGDRERRNAAVTGEISTAPRRGITFRASATVARAEWQVGKDFIAYDDPTHVISSVNDVGLLTSDASGSWGAVTFVANDFRSIVAQGNHWRYQVDALCPVALRHRWNFSVGATIAGRDGLVYEDFVTALGRDGAVRQVSIDERRLPSQHTLDLRLEKVFGGSQGFRTGLRLDCINCTNRSVVTRVINQRNSIITGSDQDATTGRAIRVGMKLSWR